MLGKHSKTFFCVSLVFLILAIVLATWGFDKIISYQIQQNIQLDNNSMMYDKWLKLPTPLDFKVYIFNVMNPDEVNNGMKPILMEVGPYVYKEYRERTILGYGENDTIKYTLKKRFEFDPEASGDLTEDDEVTVVNVSYLAALQAINEMIPYLTPLLNKALEQFFPNLKDGFLRVKVRDLLFDGVYLSCDGTTSVLDLVCGRLSSETPPTMRKAETNGYYFSMFAQMNTTELGPFEMKRGRKDVYDLGRIVSYKNSEIMPMWDDQYCGMINGSDANIFAPIDTHNIPDKIYTFETLLCRSVYADYAGQREIFNMSTYYYEISESMFASKSANKNNKCFCKKNWSANRDGCLLMGLLNLMPCQSAPAIASLPHFYLASEELLDFFQEGVKPDKEKHNTYIYIDPVTGVVLKGVKRLQFNVEMRKMAAIPQLESVPTGLFPVLWIEEGAEIPQSILDELRSSHKQLRYMEVAKWLLLVIAIIVTIAAAIIVARAKSRFSWPSILGSGSTSVNKAI